MAQDLNALIDQALLDISKSENVSNTETKVISEYTDEDFAKMLDDISSEDEDLAKAEIEAAANSSADEDEGEESDFPILNIVGDDFYTKSVWKKIKGKYVHKTSDKTLYTIDQESGDIKIGIGDKYDDELTPELNDVEKSLVYAQRFKEAAAKKKVNRDARKVQITRMAFDQKILPLPEGFTRYDKKRLIEELTLNLRHLIKRYEEYVNRRISRLLSPVIPQSVKVMKLKYPWIFIQNPGFLYKTHPKSGEVKTFWVNPDVPYYFKQGTEQEILEERDLELVPYFLENVDRAIHRWYDAKRRLADKEVSYATKIVSNNLRTYHDLLKYNPFWFEILYNVMKDEKSRGTKAV